MMMYIGHHIYFNQTYWLSCIAYSANALFIGAGLCSPVLLTSILLTPFIFWLGNLKHPLSLNLGEPYSSTPSGQCLLSCGVRLRERHKKTRFNQHLGRNPFWGETLIETGFNLLLSTTTTPQYHIYLNGTRGLWGFQQNIFCWDSVRRLFGLFATRCEVVAKSLLV